LPYDCPTINKIVNDFLAEDDKMALATLKIYLAELNRTPLGDLRFAVSEQGLAAVGWAKSQRQLDAYLQRLKADVTENPKITALYAKEISEYLKGKRRVFTFPIDWLTLKPFQRMALQAVYAIPYGETRTYAQIAAQIGRPRAYRAVGRANAANPMPLAIPCHRVIGADGKLHGYGGGDGLPTKEWLLLLEGATLA
jgi:methylated-DNA-[protein]-cysteine S-methyltransferase